MGVAMSGREPPRPRHGTAICIRFGGYVLVLGYIRAHGGGR